jgi:hypothetical protein
MLLLAADLPIRLIAPVTRRNRAVSGGTGLS